MLARLAKVAAIVALLCGSAWAGTFIIPTLPSNTTTFDSTELGTGNTLDTTKLIVTQSGSQPSSSNALARSVTSAGGTVVASGINITTHLYNAQRTGWNSTETVLNTTNVAGANFGVIATNSSLDGIVYGQPVIMAGLTIAGGSHNVVYVGTSNNTVYGLDDTTAGVLVSRNLGTPVPNTAVN